MTTASTIYDQLRNFDIPADERFEFIELYAKLVNCPQDILNLTKLYEDEENSVLRHEISAQLLQINSKKPEVLKPIITEIEDFLINITINDKSIVARHEAIESLSSIGSNKSYDFLLNLSSIEKNKDILDTIKISLPIIKIRLKINEKSYSQQEYCQ